MPIWDSRKHTKNKFYKSTSCEKEETQNLIDGLACSIPINIVRIEDISSDPQIISSNIDAVKIRNGKLSSSLSFSSALI